MLFNSIYFAIFFPIVFLVYWVLLKGSTRKQNIFLLISSYFFYGCWDWRFLFLLAISTLLCYYSGIIIKGASTIKKRKLYLIVSLTLNLGFLAVFKYFNFFIESFSDFLILFGLNPHIHTLQIILPVGISFYTFHGLSYIIDIYNEKIEPTRNWVNYSLFVSYFPLLVAGPIERATHLLPQLEQKRIFDYSKATDGLRQILWGLFKKVVIADGCAEYANLMFNHNTDQSGSSLLLGAIFFAFQIYGDFSGYSDIALGTSRLLGIELLQNFKFPYFSRDITEFWRRWHVSLSSWFKDYLYIPLGGSRGGMLKTIRNTFLIFLVSGFWHGANWTFIVWGGLHALYIIPSVVLRQNRRNLEVVAKGSMLPSIKDAIHMFVTFTLIVFAWIFFRADSINHACDYISGIFSKSFLSFPNNGGNVYTYTLFILFMLLVEWIGRESKYALENLPCLRRPVARYSFYYLVLILIFLFMGSEQAFIYFQF